MKILKASKTPPTIPVSNNSCQHNHFSVMIFVDNYETCEDPSTMSDFCYECTDIRRFDNYADALHFYNNPETSLYFIEYPGQLEDIGAVIRIISADSIDELEKKERQLIEKYAQKIIEH